MLKDREGLLISESDVITLYCQPGFFIGTTADAGFMCLVEDRILISRQSSMNTTLELSETNVGTVFMDVDKAIKELSPIKKSLLSFNSNLKPRIKFPKSEELQNKNYIARRLTRPVFFPSKYK